MATRYSQPQSGPFVPSPYWLSRGLQMVFDGQRVVWSRRDSGGSSVTKAGTPKSVATPTGLTTGFGTTYGTGTTDRVDSGLLDSPRTGMRSVVAKLYANGTGGGGLGRVFQSTSGSGIATIGDEGMWFAAGGMSIVRVNSIGTGVQYSTTAAFPLSRWAVFGSSCLYDYPTNTVPALFVDGVPVAVTTNAAATAVFSAGTTMNVGWGNRASDSARGWDGMIGPVLIFDGYLTAQEHAQLAANPWQIFQPSNRQALVAATAGGVTLTGQAVVAALGSLTPASSVPLTGQALVAGQGALSPQLTIALTGTGTTLGVGQLAPQSSAALTGQAMAAAQGSVLPQTSVGLTGTGFVADVGSMVVPGDVTVALTGVGTTFAAGLLTPVVPAAPGKSHTDLVVRQMLIDYYTKAFEKKEAAAAGVVAPAIKFKPASRPPIEKKPQPAVKQAKSPIAGKLLAKPAAEIPRSLYLAPAPADLVTLALKFNTLNLDFSAFVKEQEALKRKREDEDLLLLASIF